jgi:uncharacterized Ntn-hydrolase superfamily protein
MILFTLLLGLAVQLPQTDTLREKALPRQDGAPRSRPAHGQKLAHTYSIVAWDSLTGDLGVAVQSKFPNVGGLVPWARAGVGAVATQSLANTDYGEKGLDLLAQGATAEEALRIIMRTDTMLGDRQVGIVDAHGNAASFTGERDFDWAGGRVGNGSGGDTEGGKGAVIVGHGFSTQANIMMSDQTVKNLAASFEASHGSLADRLVAALKAGQAGGGDKRGMQSAALLVVRKNGGYLGATDRFIDIRVYDAKDPIAELERLLTLHKLHFFPSDPGDLVPITPDILQQLQPILLSEPANQPKKWLSAPETGVSRKFLEALRDFMYWENYDVRVRMDGKIDRVVLRDILAKRRGGCALLSHRAEHDDGDIVGPAAVQSVLHQRLADLFRRGELRQALANLLVGHMLGEAVGAEQMHIARGKQERRHDRMGLPADRARQHMREGASEDVGARQNTLVHQILGHRLVPGELLQDPVAQPIDPAVTDLQDIEHRPDADRERERGGHTGHSAARLARSLHGRVRFQRRVPQRVHEHRFVGGIGAVEALHRVRDVGRHRLERRATGGFPTRVPTHAVRDHREGGQALARQLQQFRIGQTGGNDLHGLVQTREQEIVLVLLPDQSLMSAAEEIQLLVARLGRHFGSCTGRLAGAGFARGG